MVNNVRAPIRLGKYELTLPDLKYSGQSENCFTWTVDMLQKALEILDTDKSGEVDREECTAPAS